MPLRLEIKKKLHTRTERVKSVDFHPTEKWVLSALYSGYLMIHNWKDQVTVRTFEVCPNTAIRCAKFIARKDWVICGSDDMLIRVFNVHSMEKIKQFEAHTDFIRYIAVHPSLPLVLTSSDDMTTRLWDWSRDWCRVATFEGHLHYVMMCQWNPKDPHIFATASLDRTIKVWGTQPSGAGAASMGITVSQPHFSLVGHECGVNCIEYSPNGDKPYIVSGGDDHTIRLWDYQTKQCITIFNKLSKTVLSATFHSYLPIILSGGDDGMLYIWHTNTYRLETTLNYNMGRIWGVACDTQTNTIALATDAGTIALKLGSEKAVASMQGGKIIMAKASEIQAVNVRMADETLYVDGDALPLPVKDMGASEIFPQKILHHPNGRLIAICGDGEYVIYTSQALRNKAFGKAVDFVWSSEGHYAIRTDTGKIVVYHNFQEHAAFTPPFTPEDMFGGRLIGICGFDFICFYDWQDTRLVRRIDVRPHCVIWKDSGESVVLGCQDSFFILGYNHATVAAAIKNTPQEQRSEEDMGVEDAFEVEWDEMPEHIESGLWVGDCFAFTTARLRLQTLMSGLFDTLAFLDHPARLLGYLPETNRLYLIDRHLNVITYQLHMSLILYQTAICRRDFAAAARFFPSIPEHLHNGVARFLDTQGHKETALQVTKDADHKFELARALGKLELCAKIIQEAQKTTSQSDTVYTNQWKQLGDLALDRGAIPLALACFKEAQDPNGQLLVHASARDLTGLRTTADLAVRKEQEHVAFMAYVALRDSEKCLNTLIGAQRLPEAALFARTYVPSRVDEVVDLWKAHLRSLGRTKIAETLASPSQNPEVFPEFEIALQKEKALRDAPKMAPPVGGVSQRHLNASAPKTTDLLTPNENQVVEPLLVAPTTNASPLTAGPCGQSSSSSLGNNGDAALLASGSSNVSVKETAGWNTPSPGRQRVTNSSTASDANPFNDAGHQEVEMNVASHSLQESSLSGAGPQASVPLFSGTSSEQIAPHPVNSNNHLLLTGLSTTPAQPAPAQPISPGQGNPFGTRYSSSTGSFDISLHSNQESSHEAAGSEADPQ